MEEKIILIVDEHEDIVQHFETQKNKTIHCIKISSGQRAIKIVASRKVDVAIIARCLPDIDGLKVLKEFQLKYPHIPVIFVAASPTFDLALSAFRAGAKDFFRRPINWEEFDSKIFALLFQNYSIKKQLESPIEKSKSKKRRISFSYVNDLIFEKNWLPWFPTLKSKKVTPELVDDDLIQKCDNIRAEQLSKNQEVILIGKKQGSQITIDEEYEQVFLPSLRVFLLGKFSVLVNDHPIEHWPSRKVKTLFAYLVFNHKKRIYKDILMDKFWPDHDLDSARNCLNVAMHSLRKIFYEINANQDFIQYKDECYYLNPEIEIYLDVEEFLQHWRVAQSTEREKEIFAALGYYELAAALYKGDFMEEDIYDTWQDLERENLKEIYLVILDRISNYYSLDGKPEIAINLCDQILEKDNCREDIHQRIMRCYYRIGKRDKALKQFRKCVETLKIELDVEPMRTTLELYSKIKKDCLYN